MTFTDWLVGAEMALSAAVLVAILERRERGDYGTRPIEIVGTVVALGLVAGVVIFG